MKMTKSEQAGFNSIIQTLEIVAKGISKTENRLQAKYYIEDLKHIRALLQANEIESIYITMLQYKAFDFAETTITGYLEATSSGKMKRRLTKDYKAFHRLKVKIKKCMNQKQLPNMN